MLLWGGILGSWKVRGKGVMGFLVQVLCSADRKTEPPQEPSHVEVSD